MSASKLLILIDDDALVHLNWSIQCKDRGVPFRGFKSVAEFITASDSIPKDAVIYIDSNLGHGIKGEVESEKIFKLGYPELHLATGYDKAEIKRPHWIKSVGPKDVPH